LLQYKFHFSLQPNGAGSSSGAALSRPDATAWLYLAFLLGSASNKGEKAMLINIQVPEAAKLLWELFEALPEESKPAFAQKVDAMASTFEHPNLAGSVLFTFGGNGTL
jgi:hypothetical protein